MIPVPGHRGYTKSDARQVFACPKCGAAIGDCCVSPKGNPTRTTHPERVAAFVAAHGDTRWFPMQEDRRAVSDEVYASLKALLSGRGKAARSMQTWPLWLAQWNAALVACGLNDDTGFRREMNARNEIVASLFVRPAFAIVRRDGGGSLVAVHVAPRDPRPEFTIAVIDGDSAEDAVRTAGAMGIRA